VGVLTDLAGAASDRAGWIAFVSLLLSVSGGAWRALTGVNPRIVIGDTHRAIVADLQRQLNETKERERRNFEGWMKALNVAESVTSEKVLPRVEDSP
jgi:molybdopterin converting factor small subunit